MVARSFKNHEYTTPRYWISLSPEITPGSRCGFGEQAHVIPDGNILVINCGSSSIKFSLVDHKKSSHLIRGSVERIGAGERIPKMHGD